MKRAYVDSCIWMTRFEGKAVYKRVIEEQLKRLVADGWEFCISEAVFLEGGSGLILTDLYIQIMMGS